MGRGFVPFRCTLEISWNRKGEKVFLYLQEFLADASNIDLFAISRKC